MFSILCFYLFCSQVQTRFTNLRARSNRGIIADQIACIGQQGIPIVRLLILFPNMMYIL